jgi:multidrug efflux pump subunit AcrB
MTSRSVSNSTNRPMSPTRSQGLAVESILAAVLVGLMVLLFLRDWRSVIVVVLNIPLALIGSVVALALTGQTINLMTLGGLSLAVGILVDEATVEVENIHTQMEKTDSIALAVRRGNAETAVPRLLAMLCILAVFIPSFFMQGTARGLVRADVAGRRLRHDRSYLLSSTFVPVLSVWLLAKHPVSTTGPTSGGESPWRQRLGHLLMRTIRARWQVVPVYLGVAALLTLVLGRQLGTDIFPQVDAGQFQFRLHAPDGTRIEQTEAITQEALEFIKKEAGPENVLISLGYVGVVPSSYPINSVYLWMGGPEEAVVRVSLKRGAVRVEDFKATLRKKLPDHLRAWVKQKWINEDVPAASVERLVKDLSLSFEPADIVNEIMSFGSPTPIEVVVSGVEDGGQPRIRRENTRATGPRAKYPRFALCSVAELPHRGRPHQSGESGRFGRDE